MFELSVQGHMAAAHYLRNYLGPCQHLHGHTWQVEVALKSDHLDNVGMVVDFAILKKVLDQVIDPLDHVCLNDLEYFKKVNPTTENIAQYIYQQFLPALEDYFQSLKQACPKPTLTHVRVWESNKASVTYTEG